MSKVNYKVNKDVGLVVATMDDVRYDAACVINKCYGGEKIGADEVLELSKAGIVIPEMEENTIRNKFVGVAKCHEEDSFDETTGMDIARRRMLIKYNKEKLAIVQAHIDRIEEILDKLEDYEDKIYDKLEELEDELEDIVDND